MSLSKCYSMWSTALCPYIKQRPTGAVTGAEIAALGLEYHNGHTSKALCPLWVVEKGMWQTFVFLLVMKIPSLVQCNNNFRLGCDYDVCSRCAGL
jgi:hypothetical protein